MRDETARHRERLLKIYRAALAAVHGRCRVADSLRRHPFAGPFHVIAVGKAAPAMTHGVLDVKADEAARLLVICPHGVGEELEGLHPALTRVTAGHPLPDEGSLRAGSLLWDFIAAAPPGEAFLVLVSGGASALLELPRPGITLEDLQRVNRWLLGSGLPIQEMNAVRRALSRIKGGGLLSLLVGRRIRGLLMSDVPGDDPAVIGSGLLARPFDHRLPDALPDWLQALVSRAQGSGTDQLQVSHGRIPDFLETQVIAANRDARRAAVQAARVLGYEVHEHQKLLIGDVNDAAKRLTACLVAEVPSLHVWGGELTLQLPDQPGNGGRCQHLALSVAQELARNLPDESPYLFLAAGSDGRDGPGGAAGALVDHGTLVRACQAGWSASDCLRRADAGSLLAASGDLLMTGPTGGNVMDLMLGLRW